MPGRTNAARQVRKDIEALTIKLVETGLADDQNLPYEAPAGPRLVTIEYPNARPMATMLKDRPYTELYEELLERRAYNVRMLDGALIQMIYEFEDDKLRRSRLAFLPSPDLLEFQSNPELYLEEMLYSDVVDPKAVTVPLRIDYDIREGVAKSLEHPASHLTLGQYTNCRIATTAPLAPYAFTEFLLRAFYNTASHAVSLDIHDSGHRFPESITTEERQLVHLGVPN